MERKGGSSMWGNITVFNWKYFTGNVSIAFVQTKLTQKNLVTKICVS